MSRKTKKVLCGCLCLVLCLSIKSVAQGDGDHDRDRGGGSGGPGGPGGLVGPGGPKEPRHSDRGKGRSVTAPHNALQFGPVGRWWDNRQVVQSIGLRREQQKRMDAIFDANKPAILDSYKVFLKAEASLTAVNKDPQANKDQVFAAIDGVNQARSSLQKATSSMLLQIRKEMDTDQIDKLEKIE
jgi:hypothetical protein